MRQVNFLSIIRKNALKTLISEAMGHPHDPSYTQKVTHWLHKHPSYNLNHFDWLSLALPCGGNGYVPGVVEALLQHGLSLDRQIKKKDGVHTLLERYSGHPAQFFLLVQQGNISQELRDRCFINAVVQKNGASAELLMGNGTAMPLMGIRKAFEHPDIVGSQKIPLWQTLLTHKPSRTLLANHSKAFGQCLKAAICSENNAAVEALCRDKAFTSVLDNYPLVKEGLEEACNVGNDAAFSILLQQKDARHILKYHGAALLTSAIISGRGRWVDKLLMDGAAPNETTLAVAKHCGNKALEERIKKAAEQPEPVCDRKESTNKQPYFTTHYASGTVHKKHRIQHQYRQKTVRSGTSYQEGIASTKISQELGQMIQQGFNSIL